MSMDGRARTSLLVAAAILGTIGSSRAGDVSVTMPRYRLERGQEIRYRRTSEFRHEKGVDREKDDWTIWVTRTNPDGSYRIILRHSSVSTTEHGKSSSNAEGPPPEVTIGHCDMDDRGRIVDGKGLGYRLHPSRDLFPRLPTSEAEVESGWEQVINLGDRMRLTELPGRSDSSISAFQGVRVSPLDKIYLSSWKNLFLFDRSRGLVRRIEEQYTWGFHSKGEGSGSIDLESVKLRDADWLKVFDASAERYIAANKMYQEVYEIGRGGAGNLDAEMDRAKETLEAARREIEEPIFREALDRLLARHEGLKTYIVESAKNRAEVLGKAAADWDAKDLAGKSHAMKDYRGKVVLLDFWYRGCGWCIRAMPQLKQVADDFRDQPMAILGINKDQDAGDARFVADAMALNYPTVLAQDVAEKFKVRGFPTLIVVDQAGKVAEIHVGYSPDLREKLKKSVKSLLEK